MMNNSQCKTGVHCPRCGNIDFNTFTITRRYNNRQHQAPINACKKCGFLWIEDTDLLELAAWEVKELFIKDLKALGKEYTSPT